MKLVTPAKRPSRTTQQRLAGAVVLVVLGAACRESAPGDSSSSSSGASNSSDDGTTASTGPLPGRVPPEPFVLPEGCGDGVPVSGQYDCHFPVSLDYLKDSMGSRQDPSRFHAWDMDGDGRDELLADAPGHSPNPRVMAPLRWNGESFDVGRVAGFKTYLGLWTPRFDINGDGQRDYVRFDGDMIGYSLATSSFELEDEQRPASFDNSPWGRPGALDIDGDGTLEALAVIRTDFGGRELWLHRNVDGRWTPIGEVLPLPGCRWPEHFAWADFDGDGHEDIALLNFWLGCDNYPPQYDPSWHSISVFFNEPLTQTLVPGPVIPVGAPPYEDLFWLDDFDGDGNLDFLVDITSGPNFGPAGVALVRGHGDGTFDEGVPVVLPDIPRWVVKGRGDLDGDGDLDWILYGDIVVDDIFADEPEIVHVHSDVIGYEGRPWTGSRAFGDFNGDGVLDYVGSHRDTNGNYGMVAMISAP
jgi:hypothetical protein